MGSKGLEAIRTVASSTRPPGRGLQRCFLSNLLENAWSAEVTLALVPERAVWQHLPVVVDVATIAGLRFPYDLHWHPAATPLMSVNVEPAHRQPAGVRC